MVRLTWLMGLSCLAVALIVASGQSGGDKTQPKTKVQLPTHFKKLGLSDEQKKKVYEVRAGFASKIQALQEQLDNLKKADIQECVKLLTDDQRALYRKILTEKIPDDKKEPPKK